jgi:hypothetical protein
VSQLFVRPLRASDPPIIPLNRLDEFIEQVFHNHAELYAHHRRLVDKLHVIQKREHPMIDSVASVLFTAITEFHDAYMEYIPNYPIAAYRIDDEMANNPLFKEFFAVRSFSVLHCLVYTEESGSGMCTTP